MTPSAVAKLVEKWRKNEDNAYRQIVYEQCAAELESVLATAPPEQRVERCPTCTSSVRTIKAGLAYGVLEPGDCNDKWHDQPQAASDGVLSADLETFASNWRNYLLAEREYFSKMDELETINNHESVARAWCRGTAHAEDNLGRITELLRLAAALAAHDQKVRREVLKGQAPDYLAAEIVSGLENRGYMDLHFNKDDASSAKEFVVELLIDQEAEIRDRVLEEAANKVTEMARCPLHGKNRHHDCVDCHNCGNVYRAIRSLASGAMEKKDDR